MSLKEADLYSSVKQFIKKKPNCIEVFVEAGKQGIGSVDVFGVYYVNNEKTEIETIGVEVKIDKIPISANFGQAKGYTLFCDRVFFASLDKVDEADRRFNEDDVEIARHLGIGLIQIQRNEAGYLCKEVLDAPKCESMKKYYDYTLRSKKFFTCKSCRKIQYSQTTVVSTMPTEWTLKEINKGKGLLIRKEGKEEFYCNECSKSKLSDREFS